MLKIVLIFLMGLLVLCFAIANSCGEYKKDAEDEEQIKYLREYQDKKQRSRGHNTDKL